MWALLHDFEKKYYEVIFWNMSQKTTIYLTSHSKAQNILAIIFVLK